MTPLSLAKNECANYRPYCNEGFPDEPHRCLQLDTLELALLRDRKAAIAGRACRLAKPGQPCQYFEDAVLGSAFFARANEPATVFEYAQAAYPKANQRPPEKLRGFMARAAKLLKDTNARICPACQANPLPKRKRLCDDCSKAKRRASNRAAQAKRRVAIPLVSSRAT